MQTESELACWPKTSIKLRPLLTTESALDLEALFKVLANDTRLRLLHALVLYDELCVNDLATTLEMKPQAISNQLQRLTDQGILNFRRNGNNIYYRIADPCIISLLDEGLCLWEDSQARKA